MYNLAFLYLDGRGVENDETKGAELLENVAEEGMADAQNFLGNLYYQGRGVSCDNQKAMYWYQKAAESGQPYGWLNLGHMYEQGRGVAPNAAAAAGLMDAQREIGICYKEGKGVKSDSNTAKKWLKKAVDQGDKEAKKVLDSMCFITTAVCGSFHKPDDCYELTMFRSFRDNWLLYQPDGEALVHEYYDIAPKIVAKINKNPMHASIFETIWNTYLRKCLSFIEEKKYEKCRNLYVKMVRTLEHTYLS